LFYKNPAKVWNEALPIGNGRLGAMVFGGIDTERIQLNEDSCWSGGFRDRVNASAREALPKIRRYLREGRILEAEDLSRYALTGTPEYQRVYQSLGDLFLCFRDIGSALGGYERRLCLDEAVAVTEFEDGGWKYRREVLASAPGDVIAVKLTTDKPEGMDFDARLVRNRYCNSSGAVGGDMVFVDGGDGIYFYAALTAEADGGSLEAIGEYLVFRGVKSAVLYVNAATSFRHDDPAAECQRVLRAAMTLGYDALRAEHVKDYRALEGRVSLSLGSDSNSGLPTDERLRAVQAGASDCGLIALYFRYGRYLLIASSRPGTLPANLQGIWNESFLPPWDSKYTININIQMNYWPAEICNLAECHVPLFEHLHRMHPRGRKVAEEMYGARGFVAHHNTDIWGDCAPQDTYLPATYWVMSVAWFCLHIWEHYEYNLDADFLARHFDLMKDACLFFADYLIENEAGQLVVSPTMSPENTYVLEDGTKATLAEGCVMDSQILWELFSAFEGACEVLGRDTDMAGQVAEMRSKLPPTQIGENGGIMEWLDEKTEAEPGHRHMSHLFALFPGGQISPETPELARAAERTLDLRLTHGGGHTGWSRAWIINFWARLRNGNEAERHLTELLRHSTLPNLFDDHPPFQIDGNFGAAAAVAHMLLQSGDGGVRLLPALPDEWQCGSVKGLCAKGGLVLDFEWENGAVTGVRVLARADYEGKLIWGEREAELKLASGERFSW